jgi:hypothetical protein
MRWNGGGGGFDVIYQELAEQFYACSTVLQRVRDEVRATTNADILALYERWVSHPDQGTTEQLTALGVLPVRGGEES